MLEDCKLWDFNDSVILSFENAALQVLMSVSVCVQVEILPDSKLLQPTQTNPEQNRPIQTYSVPFGPISPIQSYSVLLSAKVLQFEQLTRTSQCLFLNLMNTTTTTTST